MEHSITILIDDVDNLMSLIDNHSISLSPSSNTRSGERFVKDPLTEILFLEPNKDERKSINSLLCELKERFISFGYRWTFDSVNDQQSGEIHYRCLDGFEQYLEWDDRDKNKLFLHELIDAHHNGDMVVSDLIATVQSRYLPEEWSSVCRFVETA